MLTNESGFKPTNEIKDVFDECVKKADSKKVRGVDSLIDPQTRITTSCGSGVTACVLIAALEILDKKDNVRLFDGSWTEYGMSDLPVEK